jgi:hypothetical protein
LGGKPARIDLLEGPVKARLAASIALAAALLVGTSACTLVSVNGTLVEYQPSDGAGASVGDIQVRNVLGLSEDGKDVALVLSLVNEGQKSQTVTLQYENADGKKVDTAFVVPAGEALEIGHSADDQFVLRGVDVIVGSRIDVHFSLGGGGAAKTVQVPVLDGTQVEYSDLLPGAEPSPSPSSTDNATKPEPDADVDADVDVE